jgi:hypothetical protein
MLAKQHDVGISAPSVSDPPPLFELRRGLAGALAKAGAWPFDRLRAILSVVEGWQALGVGPQRRSKEDAR